MVARVIPCSGSPCVAGKGDIQPKPRCGCCVGRICVLQTQAYPDCSSQLWQPLDVSNVAAVTIAVSDLLGLDFGAGYGSTCLACQSGLRAPQAAGKGLPESVLRWTQVLCRRRSTIM
jgi:hypothetical protein